MQAFLFFFFFCAYRETGFPHTAYMNKSVMSITIVRRRDLCATYSRRKLVGVYLIFILCLCRKRETIPNPENSRISVCSAYLRSFALDLVSLSSEAETQQLRLSECDRSKSELVDINIYRITKYTYTHVSTSISKYCISISRGSISHYIANDRAFIVRRI